MLRSDGEGDGLARPLGRQRRFLAREVQHRAHAPDLRIGHRPRHVAGEAEALLAAFERLVDVSQRPEHDCQVRHGTGARIAQRLVDLVGMIGPLVQRDGVLEMCTGDLELGREEVDETEVEVRLDAGGAIVALATETHHLFGQVQGGAIVGSEQVVHPLATDDEQELGVIAQAAHTWLARASRRRRPRGPRSPVPPATRRRGG